MLSLRYLLAFAQLPGASVSLFQSIRSKFDSIERLFSLSRAELSMHQLQQRLIDAILSVNWRQVEQMLAWAAQPMQAIIGFDDARYSNTLRQIASPPLLLCAKGSVDLLKKPAIAVVGARRATPRGCGNAHYFAKELSLMGMAVVSGLALGIDRAAHEAALPMPGSTIAVLAHGLDQVYPRAHQSLAKQIVRQGGLLLSEFLLGVPPIPRRFPQRNRIISGLSHGVVVIEAARKSGSLVTARLAAEQGREVFAVPGDIEQPLHVGCHDLIQQGAKLTGCVADILEELPVDGRSMLSASHDGFSSAHVIPAKAGIQASISEGLHSPTVEDDPQGELAALNAQENAILRHFGQSVCGVDQIVSESGLAFEQVCSMLVSLEIKGCLQSVPGGYLRISSVTKKSPCKPL